MNTKRMIVTLGLALFVGSLVMGCGAELNPKFEKSLSSAMDAKKGEFQECYETALQADREAKGEMDLVLEFKPDSKKVQKAEVKKSDIKDGDMKKCVKKAAKGIKTTEAPGVDVEGKYKVDFRHKK